MRIKSCNTPVLVFKNNCGGIYIKLKYHILNMGRQKGSVVDSIYVSKYNYKKLQHVNKSKYVGRGGGGRRININHERRGK
jgi:hypothetical protein